MKKLQETLKSVNEATWMPDMLRRNYPKASSMVGQVSKAVDYDIFSAGAFAVALLEDVNAHDEAKKLNSILFKLLTVPA